MFRGLSFEDGDAAVWTIFVRKLPENVSKSNRNKESIIPCTQGNTSQRVAIFGSSSEISVDEQLFECQEWVLVFSCCW